MAVAAVEPAGPEDQGPWSVVVVVNDCWSFCDSDDDRGDYSNNNFNNNIN